MSEQEIVRVRLGKCFLCLEDVEEEVPVRMSFQVKEPLICLKCRKGLLKLIRPDLK